MDSVATLQDVVAQVTRLVDGTTEEQLSEKTPCAEWTVKDLIAHLVGGARLFGDVLLGRPVGAMGLASLPDDVEGIRREWADGRDHVIAGFSAPGALERTATFPWGEMPGEAAANLAVFDVTTHAVDLATATGQAPPPDELVERALAVGRRMIGPDFRAPGMFDPEQTVPEDAPAAQRLLAFAGRAV